MKKIFTTIGRGAVRVGTTILRFFGTLEKVDEIYHEMTPEAKATAIKHFQDLLAFVAACSAAGAAGGENLPLDSAVLAAAEQLYRDAVQDIGAAKKVFAALGITLPASSVPAVPTVPAAA